MPEHPEPQPEPMTARGEGCASTNADRKLGKSATGRSRGIARPVTVACSCVRAGRIGMVTDAGCNVISASVRLLRCESSSRPATSEPMLLRSEPEAGTKTESWLIAAASLSARGDSHPLRRSGARCICSLSDTAEFRARSARCSVQRSAAPRENMRWRCWPMHPARRCRRTR